MTEVSSNIIEYLNSLFGEELTAKYLKFIDEEPLRYLRINTLKTGRNELKNTLKTEYGIETEDVEGIDIALKVTGGDLLAGKALEHALGKFYIQSLSSMIPPLILNPASDDKVLDLCAAPGSKTTELAAIMQNKGTLIANEVSMDRLKVLVYNIDKMNVANAGVLHFKGEILSKVYSNYFDKILVDAPCSGLGIIQKKGEVNNWWTKEKAEGLGDLQIKLLVAAIKMLRPGGELVYSTCTMTVEENEFVIDKILQKYPVDVVDFEMPVKSIPAFSNYKGLTFDSRVTKGKRILPWEINSEGFFIIKLIKTDLTANLESLTFKETDLKFLEYNSKELYKFFKEAVEEFGIKEEKFAGYKYLLKNNDVYAIDKDYDDTELGKYERIGFRFGIIDKKYSLTLHTQAIQLLGVYAEKNVYELTDKEELKVYLEGRIIKKSGYKGQMIITYKGTVLGTAIASKDGIKSRFPRAKRTQDIAYY